MKSNNLLNNTKENDQEFECLWEFKNFFLEKHFEFLSLLIKIYRYSFDLSYLNDAYDQIENHSNESNMLFYIRNFILIDINITTREVANIFWKQQENQLNIYAIFILKEDTYLSKLNFKKIKDDLSLLVHPDKTTFNNKSSSQNRKNKFFDWDSETTSSIYWHSKQIMDNDMYMRESINEFTLYFKKENVRNTFCTQFLEFIFNKENNLLLKKCILNNFIEWIIRKFKSKKLKNNHFFIKNNDTVEINNEDSLIKENEKILSIIYNCHLEDIKQQLYAKFKNQYSIIINGLKHDQSLTQIVDLIKNSYFNKY